MAVLYDVIVEIVSTVGAADLTVSAFLLEAVGVHQDLYSNQVIYLSLIHI